jgi:hypothetical protein
MFIFISFKHYNFAFITLTHVFVLNLPCGARGCKMLLSLFRMQVKVKKHCCTHYICQTEPQRFTPLPHLSLLTYLQYLSMYLCPNYVANVTGPPPRVHTCYHQNSDMAMLFLFYKHITLTKVANSVNTYDQI